MLWIEFITSAVIIVLAGIRLTIYADRLSDHFQWGKMWIGIILLGFVTSLPEAITSIASVITLNADDLAIGNIFGSINFNILLVAVMDLFYRGGSFTNAVICRPVHLWSGFCAMLLSFIVIFEILLSHKIGLVSLGPLSLGLVLVAILYFGGMKKIADLELSADGLFIKEARGASKYSSWEVIGNILVSIIIVVVGAIWLASSADKLAEYTGFGRTFFGSIFLAVVTSLPEMVVSLAALKLGSFDLALGNIFGSNMTNVFIIFLCGLFHKGDGILSLVSPIHVMSGAVGILMTFLVLKSIQVDHKKTIGNVGIDSIALFLIFILWTGVLYLFK